MLQVAPGPWTTAVAIGVVWVGCFLAVAAAERCLQVCLSRPYAAPPGELEMVAVLCAGITVMGTGPVADIRPLSATLQPPQVCLAVAV